MSVASTIAETLYYIWRDKQLEGRQDGAGRQVGALGREEAKTQDR